jgi:hypothetical protein
VGRDATIVRSAPGETVVAQTIAGWLNTGPGDVVRVEAAHTKLTRYISVYVCDQEE